MEVKTFFNKYYFYYDLSENNTEMKETLTKQCLGIFLFTTNFNNNLQITLYSVNGNAFTFYDKWVFNSLN